MRLSKLRPPSVLLLSLMLRLLLEVAFWQYRNNTFIFRLVVKVKNNHFHCNHKHKSHSRRSLTLKSGVVSRYHCCPIKINSQPWLWKCLLAVPQGKLKTPLFNFDSAFLQPFTSCEISECDLCYWLLKGSYYYYIRPVSGKNSTFSGYNFDGQSGPKRFHSTLCSWGNLLSWVQAIL